MRRHPGGLGFRIVPCALLVAAAVTSATAQQPASAPFSDVMRSAWYHVNELVLAAAKGMPAEHYTFRPTRDVRTFGEILGHLAGEHYAICGAVSGRPAPATNLEKLTSREDLLKVLQDSSAVCDLAFGLLTDENAGFRYTVYNTVSSRFSLLTDTIVHDNEHYGNLATYMRLKSVVPPSRGQ